MKLIAIIDSLFLLIGLPSNVTLILAIFFSATREIKTYSIIQFSIAICDIIRVTSEFIVQERLIFQWPYTVFIYQGPCIIGGKDLCWFLQTIIMNFFFYTIFLITFSIWYRNAALSGFLPGPCFVRTTLCILGLPIIFYMCTFTTADSNESASVILSKHPQEEISSLVYVGMSTRALTPMLFTVSTLIFPIPAYIVISYQCIKADPLTNTKIHHSLRF